MKVAILFGGNSTEHDVSCMSASSVLKNIGENHEILKVGISNSGNWFATTASIKEIENAEWDSLSEKNEPLLFSPNDGAFVYGNKSFKPDVVFPVLHGKNGEDGTVQGLLETLGIPYVGSRVFGTALCMDKAYAKIVFEAAGIKQVSWVTVEKCDFKKNYAAAKSQIAKLDFPVFVKPSNAGSSIGITKCTDLEEVEAALETAFTIDRRAVVESGVKNPIELEVAVYGNDEPVATVSGKILSANEFYDYEAKYINENSRTVAPSGFENEEKLRAEAIRAYKACDCKGLSRVDFLVDGNSGEIYLNEINTIPGFTSISMFPKLCDVSGLSYPELIETLLFLAIEFERNK